MKAIEQQKQELTMVATKLFNDGKTTDFVIEALNNYVLNSNFSFEINVDSVQYLAKQNLGLLK